MVEYLLIGFLVGYIVGGGKLNINLKKKKRMEMTDEQKKFQKHFDGLMNYSADQAYNKGERS